MNKGYWLTVWIPIMNRANSIVKPLDGIIDQESFDENVEIIIFDNTSTDGASDTVKPYLVD